MTGLARHLTALTRIGLSIALFGAVAIWSDPLSSVPYYNVGGMLCNKPPANLTGCVEHSLCERPPPDPGNCVAEKIVCPMCGGEEPTQPPATPRPDLAKNAGGASADLTISACDSGRFAGDPINLTTGNRVHIETDYVGAGPFPLVFSRTYNSQSDVNVRFGVNWSHSYSARIYSAAGSTRILLIRPDQSALNFTFVGGRDRWESTSDTNSTIKSLYERGNFIGWEYATGSGQIETYNAQGRLQTIKTLDGLTQKLHYKGLSLWRVSDDFGRTLTFEEDSENPPFNYNKVITPRGTYKYEYDRRGNLQFVTGPDNKKREYLYENSVFLSALTGVIDENGIRFATFAYYEDGRAKSSELAGGVDKVEVKYKVANVPAILVSPMLWEQSEATNTRRSSVSREPRKLPNRR
jgi:YD repeat-containing protein